MSIHLSSGDSNSVINEAIKNSIYITRKLFSLQNNNKIGGFQNKNVSNLQNIYRILQKRGTKIILE